MKFSYYPGCSLHSTAQEFDFSSKFICSMLGMELEEIQDWNCCGATSGHAVSKYLTQSLSLRNLILAEKLAKDVIVPCAACYNLMRLSHEYIKEQSQESVSLNEEMRVIMGDCYHAGIHIYHIADILTRTDILQELKKQIKVSLNGLKVAAYYGCLLNRPAKEVSFEDNPEQPKKLDELVSITEAEIVRWTHKTECCGAGLSISRPQLIEGLAGKIIAAAKRAGADVIVTACPMCMSNLDLRQKEMPILYITELIALSMGSTDIKKYLKKHLVNPIPTLQARSELNL